MCSEPSASTGPHAGHFRESGPPPAPLGVPPGSTQPHSHVASPLCGTLSVSDWPTAFSVQGPGCRGSEARLTLVWTRAQGAWTLGREEPGPQPTAPQASLLPASPRSAHQLCPGRDGGACPPPALDPPSARAQSQGRHSPWAPGQARRPQAFPRVGDALATLDCGDASRFGSGDQWASRSCPRPRLALGTPRARRRPDEAAPRPAPASARSFRTRAHPLRLQAGPRSPETCKSARRGRLPWEPGTQARLQPARCGRIPGWDSQEPCTALPMRAARASQLQTRPIRPGPPTAAPRPPAAIPARLQLPASSDVP